MDTLASLHWVANTSAIFTHVKPTKWERLFRLIGKIFNSEILKSILEMFQKKICDKDVWIASQIFSYGPYSSLRLDIQVVARPPASLTQLLLLYPGFRYD